MPLHDSFHCLCAGADDQPAGLGASPKMLHAAKPATTGNGKQSSAGKSARKQGVFGKMMGATATAATAVT